VKVRQKQRRIMRPILATTLPIIMILALLPQSARAITLGGALGFSALSESGDVNINNVAKVGTNDLGSLGGNDITLGSNSFAGGDLIADPNGITIGNYSKVIGECFWTTGITFGLGVKNCKGGNTGGGDPGAKATAITDTNNFVAVLLGSPATLTMGPVTVKNYPGTTIADTVAGGLNIIKISGDLTLQSSSTLTLLGTGTPGETLVLWINGNLKINSGAKIRLKGGLLADDVVIYVNGNVSPWNNSTTLGATLLAPNAPINVGSSARVDGAVIGGGSVTFLQNATLLYDPATNVNLPGGPPPPPITLGDAAGFLIVSTGGTTTLGHVSFGLPAAPNAGDIGGTTATIGDFTVIDGDVVASSSSFPAITVNQHAKVVGNCITQDSPASTLVSLVGVGPSKGTCGGFTNTGSKLSKLLDSSADALTFTSELGALAADMALGPINVTTNSSLACGASSINPGVYVFTTPWIKIANSKTLTIDGTNCAGKVIAINVTGPSQTSSSALLNFGAGFTIALKNIAATNVVFNVEGASSNPDVLSGTNSTFNGTLVAPVQNCTVGSTNVTFNGQLVCGSTVKVGDNVTATFMPLVTIP
jgi:hypothetical protein